MHRAGPALAGGEGPNMILDDGGDATLLVHKGVEFEKAGAVPDPSTADSEEFAVVLGVLTRSLAEDPARWTTDRQRHQGRVRGDHHRRPPPQRDGADRRAPVPRHQRQRLRHQVQVRQQVRLPALAHRRHQPGHRRAHRRQGGRGVRLSATWARAVPSRCGARAPGWSSPRSTRSAPCRRPWRATRWPPSRTCVDTADIFVTTTGNKDVITADAHGPDEAPGHRGQHRPLRQRDRHGRADEDRRASSGSTSSPRWTSGCSPTATP